MKITVSVAEQYLSHVDPGDFGRKVALSAAPGLGSGELEALALTSLFMPTACSWDDGRGAFDICVRWP